MSSCGLSETDTISILLQQSPAISAGPEGSRNRSVSTRRAGLFLPLFELFVILLGLRNRLGVFLRLSLPECRARGLDLVFQPDKIVIDAHVRCSRRTAHQHPNKLQQR